MFADKYPRFMEASDLVPKPRRLNHRYDVIYAGNRDILEGARVLDLASHDGRYSFAALKAGAAHVTGVEVRQELVDKAQETFAFYGQDPATYRFVCGDVFDVLASEHFDVDVVMCLGFLYHTYRHTELMFRLHQLAPRHLVVDTLIALGPDPITRVFRERDPDDIRSAARDPWSVGRVVVSRPSLSALQLLLDSYGFEVESVYDWQRRLAGRPPIPGLAGYAEGKRVTVRCRSRALAASTGRAPVAPFPVAAPAGTRPSPGARTSHVGWRERVNRALAASTGYELRRTTGRR